MTAQAREEERGKEGTSIEPILREIDALVRRIREADVPQDQEYKRTQALMVLGGVADVLKAFCLGPSNQKSYVTYEFTKRDAHGGR